MGDIGIYKTRSVFSNYIDVRKPNKAWEFSLIKNEFNKWI